MQLWKQIVQTSSRALAVGHLQPIPTESLTIDDGGVPFLVRIVARLNDKPGLPDTGSASERAIATGDADAKFAACKHQSPDNNPFLPCDPELVVAELSSTHIAVLNKFNVVDHHLLIVTREYVHQSEPLAWNDFRALATCMRQYPSLGFYNSSPAAGASQPHRHLQLIRLPLSENAPCALPIESHWPDRLPFTLGCCRLTSSHSADDLARQMQAAYATLHSQFGDVPYNLLATEDWFVFVPRSRECYGQISINAMGFAGALFVKNQADLAQLKSVGPMTVLQAVGIQRDRG